MEIIRPYYIRISESISPKDKPKLVFEGLKNIFPGWRVGKQLDFSATEVRSLKIESEDANIHDLLLREVQSLDNYFSKKIAAASAALCNKISFYSYFQPSIFVLAFNRKEAEHINRSWKNLRLHRTVELELFSDPGKAYQVLLDRHEGAEIYAFALDARSSVSEVIQYLRLFEAAFGLPHQKLKKPLAKFLQSSGVSYKGGEIEQWVAA